MQKQTETTKKASRKFTVADIIEAHRLNPGLTRVYPLVKTGVILQSKVHGGSR